MKIQGFTKRISELLRAVTQWLRIEDLYATYRHEDDVIYVHLMVSKLQSVQFRVLSVPSAVSSGTWTAK